MLFTLSFLIKFSLDNPSQVRYTPEKVIGTLFMSLFSYSACNTVVVDIKHPVLQHERRDSCRNTVRKLPTFQ